jgi:hypothetical protein
MENYKEELNKLQTLLDELKSKIGKPQFEIGKWYKINSDSKIVCCYKGVCDGYGIDSGYNWSDSLLMSDISLWTLATQKEVEEALTKEAVKRGFKEGVKFKSIIYGTERVFTSDKLKLEKDGDLTNNNNTIFRCGTWATPIKTKTIDELANILKFSNGCFISDYFKDNKKEIIETLNNL